MSSASSTPSQPTVKANTDTTHNDPLHLHYMILDAGAIIKGYGLNLYTKADKIITVPEALNEIRDSKARELLLKLPYEIEERIPSISSLNYVVEFAKKSGDLANLSKTDLKLIALTHMMHIELNGSANVTQPGDIQRINTTTTHVKHASSSDNSSGLSTTTAAITATHTSTDTAAVTRSTSSVTVRADKGNSWASIVTSTTSNQAIEVIRGAVAVGTTIDGNALCAGESSTPTNGDSVVNGGSIIEGEVEDDPVVDNISNDHDGGDDDEDYHEDDDNEESFDDDDDDDDCSEDEADSDDSNINIDDGMTHVDIDLLDIDCTQSTHVSSSIAHNTDLATVTQEATLLSLTDSNFPTLPTYASATGGALHELSHIIDRKKKKNCADDWSDVPIESSYVTSFDHDCSCSSTDNHNHPPPHHHHSTSNPAIDTTATSIPVPFSAIQSTNGFQSRVIRPSGLSSGNAFTSAAENKKMHLEDDGKGWINDDNLIKFKGNASNLIYSRQQQQRDRVKKINNSTTSADHIDSNDAEHGDGKERKDGNNLDDDNAAAAAVAAIGEMIKKKKILKKLKNAKRKAAICKYKVACLTTDFTMQNVLLQMNLSVLSVDGLLVTTIRQWVLRCMSCYTVHYDMDRMFCRKCGGCHLSRVSASIDQGGKLQLHLKKNYRIDLRGSKYSLPAPGKQGRYDGELLLREDQLLSGIWKQKCIKIRKDIKSAFGEDVTSDVGLYINKSQDIRIGLGKQNPNAKKGRERRGKKKKSNSNSSSSC